VFLTLTKRVVQFLIAQHGFRATAAPEHRVVALARAELLGGVQRPPSHAVGRILPGAACLGLSSAFVATAASRGFSSESIAAALESKRMSQLTWGGLETLG